MEVSRVSSNISQIELPFFGEEKKFIPREIIFKIFSYLQPDDLGRCFQVNRQWNVVANNQVLWKALYPAIAFGKDEWRIYFGDIGEEPPLPHSIHKILQSPCPFWPGKKVQETHLLVLVPQTVNGKPLTLKTLGELIQKPLQGTATKFYVLNLGEYTDAPAAKSHWALFTRDVIEGSRNKKFSDQQALIKAKAHYEVPTILDSTIAILMEHVRTGERLYSQRSNTFIRCQEKHNKDWQLVVGWFGAAGLLVHFNCNGYEDYSVGGLRRFF